MHATQDLRPAPRAALRVNGVHKAFRDKNRETHALQGASLIARSGNITGLIGPDGAGKTTLMRIIAGLLRPDRGEVKALGVDAVAEPLKVQGQIGYMPQRFGLYEDLSVRENLDLYADLHSVPASARAGRYEELMHMTGLAPFTARLAGRLSGGMKQKLGLACTLVQPPRLLLLDEPTVGVDPVSRRELWQIIERLVGEQGMSVLLATAYLDEAERCTEVVLLHEGRLLGQGVPRHFTEGLEARVWYAERPGDTRRRLLTELQGRSEVLDAIIDRDGVRAILDKAGAPPALPGTTWQPLRPSFEDAFVERLSHSMKPGAKHRPPPKEIGQHDHATVISAHRLTRRFGDF
ncbi:MAG: ABC transporter ATP-binding protein [Acidihalobacter sp.]